MYHLELVEGHAFMEHTVVEFGWFSSVKRFIPAQVLRDSGGFRRQFLEVFGF